MDDLTPERCEVEIVRLLLERALTEFQARQDSLLAGFFLLSVTYQPLPLKTIPAGWMSRRTWP